MVAACLAVIRYYAFILGAVGCFSAGELRYSVEAVSCGVLVVRFPVVGLRVISLFRELCETSLMSGLEFELCKACRSVLAVYGSPC
jgi:hypothetical protein